MKKLLFAFFPILFFGSYKEVMYCGNNKIQTTTSGTTTTGTAMADAQDDGPYVQYKKDMVYAKYIVGNNAAKSVQTDSATLADKGNLVLRIKTYELDKYLTVQLKAKLENEKSEFKSVSKQLVLSDIEGNFYALRKLLQAGGVIDTAYNWTFGDGHLVLVGDFFDRGSHVTEALWLIYSLEEKAKAAGGYVHFILGNHEIMNLTGDVRYVNQKYKDNAALLGEKYESMYDASTELGRWLRTKNIMEKIGKMLYQHAGVSEEVNNMNLSVTAINKLARPWYADTLYKYPDPKIDTILNDLGPFWYRGYYTGVKATSQQVDNTLTLFGVHHIVTGHTIVADTISLWYNNRIMDTDVHHAAGKSEALLIENGEYYRITPEGTKFLLLKD